MKDALVRMKQGKSNSPEIQEPGYRFASLTLESDGTLRRGSTSIHLPPKELEALRLLLAHAGETVSPLQLKKALWGDVHVTEDSVPRCISSLRARLKPEECIQTVYKRGYRISVQVRRHGIVSQGWQPRLAIMPFVTGLNVPEYLGRAITEQTVARLRSTRLAPGMMQAMDSVFTLAERGLSSNQVGEALHADLVLKGSLSLLPAHYRLRAEMIRVEDGAQIWVEDLLAARTHGAGVESELVDRLVSRLGNGEISLNAAAAVLEEDGNPARREAIELFQRGHHESQTLQRRRMEGGQQLLLRATELDPSLIAAHVDLANLCITQAFLGFVAPSAAAEMVRRCAHAILGRFPGAEAILPALGWVRFHADHDLNGALEAFAASAHLPHDTCTTRARVMFALSRHRFGEAIELLKAALNEDPYSPWLHARLGWACHLAGEGAISLDQIERVITMCPRHEAAVLYGSVILSWHGDAKRGVQVAEELIQRSPQFDMATAVHGYALACTDRRDEARAILERLQWQSRERYVLRSFVPAVYVALGDLEGAVAELRAVEEARCPWFFQMLADPRLKPLRRHPEFVRMQQTLARIEAAARTQ
jgi:DNA-binding winged helix-turn-helix (wHTH) protein/tetratricopeptide (TPR) repeat protein